MPKKTTTNKGKKPADILKSKPKPKTPKRPQSRAKRNAPPDSDAPYGYNARGIPRRRPARIGKKLGAINGKRVDKYDKNKHPEAFKEQLSTGISFVSASANLGILSRTAQNWIVQHQEFADAVAIGREIGRSTLETTLIGQAQGSIVGSATSLIFYLKNRFPQDYRDRREVEVSGDSSMNISFDYEAIADRED